MTLPKFLAGISIILFVAIGVAAFFKSSSPSVASSSVVQLPPLEIELDQEIQVVAPAIEAENPPIAITEPEASTVSVVTTSVVDLPDANRMEEFFNKQGPKLPIVETVTYKSHVPWLKGRPAWISDYASHYGTSRHFIARSLNGKPDYLKQDVKEGDQFNVFRKDKNVQFYLVIDSSRCKMWFYYLDLDDKQKVLLKTYQVGLGRIDASTPSGLLTPLGKYMLGSKVVTYKPKVMGMHQGKSTELITIFGTRWIPFEKEIGECTAPAKGFGIHGTPWTMSSEGQLKDNMNSVGKYESDGCIRLATPDMEELFAIIITKPTTVEIVRDFSESTLADLNFN